MFFFAYKLFRECSKPLLLKPQNLIFQSSNNCCFFTIHFVKNFYPRIVKSLNRTSNFILILTLLLLLTSCGRKLEPTMEDYLEPERVSKFSVSVIDQKVTLQWSYPDKEKVKIKGFVIEREREGERKSLGFFDKKIESFEDKEVEIGKAYTYSIFAVKPKGILSKPNIVQVDLTKLPEIREPKAEVIPLGVRLSWQSNKNLQFNIYRVNSKGERVKIASTEVNSFIDEVSSSFLESLRDKFDEVRYIITTSKKEESLYRESSGIDVSVSLKMFTPSKPTEVFGAVSEQGVSISWKEIPQSWSSGYRVYRKTQEDRDFTLIGETLIPLYFDREYNLSNLRFPVFYKITSKGPLFESEPVQIKVEVTDG